MKHDSLTNTSDNISGIGYKFKGYQPIEHKPT